MNNTAQLRWPIDVSADATDNVGVFSVECEFRVNGGSVTTFAMPLVSGNTYKGTFTGTAGIGDLIEYRIKATDVSPLANIGYNPSTGYHAFNIIDVLGLVLIVDDDLTLANRISNDKVGELPDESIPLGASGTLFNNTLTAAGYLVEEVSWTLHLIRQTLITMIL